MRTPRGRKATEKSYKHLGKDLGWGQGGLFWNETRLL
jgi:Holliday junction DNA helicase RuvB